MGLIWQVIKQSAGDFWDELLNLIIFNAIWFIGSMFILPWPYLTFSLFFSTHEIAQGKAIKFSTFFKGAARYWKQAYIWGGINVAALFILWFNLRFYADFQANWAAIIQVLFLAIVLLWVILQLVALAIYPRLEEPSFTMALRNAGILLIRYPQFAFVLAIIVALMVIISSLFPLFAFFGAVSFIAVLVNRIVETLVEQELKRGI